MLICIFVVLFVCVVVVLVVVVSVVVVVVVMLLLLCFAALFVGYFAVTHINFSSLIVGSCNLVSFNKVFVN